ncbi:MAG: hypothetical protein ACQPRJ_02405 [Solitalea-like symbiont of Acarus siro]
MKNLIKYLLIPSILFAMCFTSYGQNPTNKKTHKIGTPDYLLVKRGFKIFKLGTPIEQYRKYVVLVAGRDEHGDSRLYKLLTSTHPGFASIGDSIEINDIILEEYNGIIAGINVLVEAKYKGALLRSLQAAYGPGSKANPYIERYTWHASGKKTDISLTYIDSYEGGGHLHGNAWALFQDNNIANKQEQDEKNKAKETVKDL